MRIESIVNVLTKKITKHNKGLKVGRHYEATHKPNKPSHFGNLEMPKDDCSNVNQMWVSYFL